MPTVEDNAMLVLMKMLDEPRKSARIYHSMTELRLQAESVPQTREYPTRGQAAAASGP